MAPSSYRWESFLGAFLLLASATGCKCSPDEVIEEEVAPPESFELLDAPEPTPAGKSRCELVPEEVRFTIRGERAPLEEAGAPDGPFSIQVGPAIAWSQGTAVGLLRPGKQVEALVVVTDGRGRHRQIELGVVHGQVDPPRLLAQGSALIAGVQDSDAAGSHLKLVRIDDPFTEAKLTWGPEVQEGRDESSLFALGISSEQDRAWLIWDREDKTAARSKIERIEFDPLTLKIRRAPHSPSFLGPDAEGPLLVPRAGGHWLLWLNYEAVKAQLGAGDADSLGLIEEPRAKLRVVPLDARGEKLAEPQILLEGHIMAVEGAAERDGSLVVLVRQDESSRDKQSLIFLRVRPDGSTHRETIEHADMGLGAPVLLREDAERPLWLVVRALDGGTLLAAIPEGLSPPALEYEPLLNQREPLVAGPVGWLVVEPRGPDLDLRHIRCGASALTPESEKN